MAIDCVLEDRQQFKSCVATIQLFKIATLQAHIKPGEEECLHPHICVCASFSFHLTPSTSPKTRRVEGRQLYFKSIVD